MQHPTTATMELNLETARTAREVETRIKAELGRLPLAEQKSVLERVAVDVLTALSAKPSNGVPTRPAARLVEPPPEDAGSDVRLWERIYVWCRANPRDTYRVVEAIDAVMADKDDR